MGNVPYILCCYTPHSVHFSLFKSPTTIKSKQQKMCTFVLYPLSHQPPCLPHAPYIGGTIIPSKCIVCMVPSIEFSLLKNRGELVRLKVYLGLGALVDAPNGRSSLPVIYCHGTDIMKTGRTLFLLLIDLIPLT